jgi:hypothetical protein
MDILDSNPLSEKICPKTRPVKNADQKSSSFSSVFKKILSETYHKPDAIGDENPSATVQFSASKQAEIPLQIIDQQIAVSRYSGKAKKYQAQPSQSSWAKYKEDQLLNHPGGDSVGLYQDITHGQFVQQESFMNRLSKDLYDAFGNMKNVCSDFMFGSTFYYRDVNNQICQAKRKGLIGSVIDFFKDAGSALTFGKWRPEGEPAPKSFLEKCGFFISKIKEAVSGDLILGVGGSVVQIGEDAALAGLNLLETIPDATIGHFKPGREITTAAFDNGQVMINYLSDIAPLGEARQRVHSLDLEELRPPILNNINQPERTYDDTRWQYVRNTHFRKSIETIGSLVWIY